MTLDELIALHEIKQTKYRYLRAVDTQDAIPLLQRPPRVTAAAAGNVEDQPAGRDEREEAHHPRGGRGRAVAFPGLCDHRPSPSRI